MGFFLKWKTKSQRQSSGTLLTIAFFALGIITYLAVPIVHEFLSHALTGWKGLLYLLGGGGVLFIWFLILGYRGKSLLYAFYVILFTLLCIWLALNFDMIWNGMLSTLGTWPTIFIGLLFALSIWLVGHLLF
jgi:hypothetical protein